MSLTFVYLNVFIWGFTCGRVCPPLCWWGAGMSGRLRCLCLHFITILNLWKLFHVLPYQRCWHCSCRQQESPRQSLWSDPRWTEHHQPYSSQSRHSWMIDINIRHYYLVTFSAFLFLPAPLVAIGSHNDAVIPEETSERSGVTLASIAWKMTKSTSDKYSSWTDAVLVSCDLEFWK